MKWLGFLLFIIPIFSQDQAQRKEQVKEQTLADIKATEEKQLQDKQALLTREQHLLALLQEMETNKTWISGKEKELLATLKKTDETKTADKKDTELVLPPELIDHYQSRDPEIAARDFVKLYQTAPEVCVALIRTMKKKKSAKLMDTVVKIDQKNGTRIASEITAAIGEGTKP